MNNLKMSSNAHLFCFNIALKELKVRKNVASCFIVSDDKLSTI